MQQLKQAKDAIEQLSERPAETQELLDSIQKLLNTILGALSENFDKQDNKSELLKQLADNPEALEQLKQLLNK